MLPRIVTPTPVASGKQISTCFHSVLHASDKIAEEWVMQTYKEKQHKDELSFFGLNEAFSIDPHWYYETNQASVFKNSVLLTITMWAAAFVAIHKQWVKELQTEKKFPMYLLSPQLLTCNFSQ